MDLDQYIFPVGVERVIKGRSLSEVVPELLARYRYERVFIVASKSLNRRTRVIRDLVKLLGDKVVGMTDEV